MSGRVSPFIPCFTCAKEFKNVQDLKKHRRELLHYKGPTLHEDWTNKQALESYFTAYYEEEVMIMRTDRRKSRRAVMNVLREMRTDFEEEEGGELYLNRPQNAGSTATQTKVYLADEYDFNLFLNIDKNDLQVFIEGSSVYYSVERRENHINHLGEEWSIVNRRRPLRVPTGYAAVRILESDEYEETEWWPDVTHDNYVIPRFIQEDLYSKAKESMRDNDTTRVSSRKHGPAITVIMKPDVVDHHISIDLVAAISINKTVSDYGWPRPRTRQVISSLVIQEVLKQNLYLVPKLNNFWYISFANAAKVLLRAIDDHGECRIRIHRILKRDFMRWKSEESFPGVSTFMFKNHLFWYNELLPSDLDREIYWKKSNIGICYMDFLEDFAKQLDKGILYNFFYPQHNILEGKDLDVLNRLTKKLRKRRKQLSKIIAV